MNKVIYFSAAQLRYELCLVCFDMVHIWYTRGDDVVQQHLILDLNWTFKTTLIEEHNVGLSALYSKFFEHVILYNETQIPKDFQDPLQLLSRCRNE